MICLLSQIDNDIGSKSKANLNVVFVTKADGFPVFVVLILATHVVGDQTINAVRPDATGDCKMRSALNTSWVVDM